jgi:hypothetical protein
MKVRELITVLRALDPEREVIITKDGEGNAHSPLAGFWEGSYVPDSTYSGEAYYDSTEGDVDPDDVRTPGEDGAIAALFLSPIC